MINVVVEGDSDLKAAITVVKAAGREVGHARSAGGKTRLDPKIKNYHRAAINASWVVFRDSDNVCPVELVRSLTDGIQSVNPRFALRIAHTMTEAWLMADREGFAKFFGVRPTQVPTEPEALTHAKQTMLNLCRSSTKRALRDDIVTRDGMTGPLYVVRINEFAGGHWNAAVAAERSPSLSRAIDAIKALP